MPLFCKNQPLNRFQRRSGLLLSSALITTALVYMGVHLLFNHHAYTGAAAYLLAALPVLPFLLLFSVILRYLLTEKDEFFRTLVLQSLVCGLAFTTVGDTIWLFLAEHTSLSTIPGMANVDIFIITSMFALAFQIRSYR